MRLSGTLQQLRLSSTLTSPYNTLRSPAVEGVPPHPASQLTVPLQDGAGGYLRVSHASLTGHL